MGSYCGFDRNKDAKIASRISTLQINLNIAGNNYNNAVAYAQS